MRLRVSTALMVAFGAVLACSVTSSQSANKDFTGDLPTGLSCPSSCNTCAQNSCGSAESCLGNQCVDFLDCFCSCAASDSDCHFICSSSRKTPDNHCADCVAAAKPCLAQKCASMSRPQPPALEWHLRRRRRAERGRRVRHIPGQRSHVPGDVRSVHPGPLLGGGLVLLHGLRCVLCLRLPLRSSGPRVPAFLHAFGGMPDVCGWRQRLRPAVLRNVRGRRRRRHYPEPRW
jgi:hypothetical protein